MGKKRVISSKLNRRLVKPKYANHNTGPSAASFLGFFRSILADYKALPLSIRILTTYISLIGAVYLLFAFYSTSVLLGAVMKGSLAKILNLSLLIVVCLVIYGIIKRKYWGWQLAVAWFFFEVLNSMASMLFSEQEAIFAGYISTGTIYIAVLNAIIIWFLFNKKNYFAANRKKPKNSRASSKAFSPIDSADKVFLLSFSILVILMLILVSSSLTTVYLETTYLSKQIVGEIDRKSLDQSIFLCSNKLGQEKDVCYVVLAVAYGAEIKDDAESKICDNIAFSFYKITCLRALA